MTLSDFENSLMDLARLIRNTIMYLSLAIHFEEQLKKDSNVALTLEKSLPLKK